MIVPTGEAILDKITLDALSRWRFKPGALMSIEVPITYTMNGGGGRAVIFSRTQKSMDEVLARYLGKGTVLNGPIPEYPDSQYWTFKKGRGVYELHAGKSGAVESVKVVKSSGDVVFDDAAQKTLGKWRLSRGPLILELPLRFVLTPDSYSVNVAR